MLKYLLIVCLFACLAMQSYAQDSASIKKVAEKYAASVSSKADQLQKKMDKQSLKVLKQMQKMEAKLQSKLSRIDSVESKRLFGGSAAKYKEWEQKLTQPGAAIVPQGNQYMVMENIFLQRELLLICVHCLQEIQVHIIPLKSLNHLKCNHLQLLLPSEKLA